MGSLFPLTFQNLSRNLYLESHWESDRGTNSHADVDFKTYSEKANLGQQGTGLHFDLSSHNWTWKPSHVSTPIQMHCLSKDSGPWPSWRAKCVCTVITAVLVEKMSWLDKCKKHEAVKFLVTWSDCSDMSFSIKAATELCTKCRSSKHCSSWWLLMTWFVKHVPVRRAWLDVWVQCKVFLVCLFRYEQYCCSNTVYQNAAPLIGRKPEFRSKPWLAEGSLIIRSLDIAADAKQNHMNRTIHPCLPSTAKSVQ